MKDATKMMRTAICLSFASLLTTSTLLADQINEIRTEQTGADSDEYVELRGNPGESLDGRFYIVVGDRENEFPPAQNGSIEAIVDLSGQSYDANGLFVIAEKTFTLGTADLVASLNFEANDNTTHFLVTGFTGALNDDVDDDNDGVLNEVLPWTSIVDSIALVKATPDGTANEYVYSDTQLFGDGTFPPSHAYRCSDTGEWRLGEFDLGVTDTPNVENQTCGGGGGGGTALINELRIDQPSSDSDEYFELVGDPGTSLDGLWFVSLGDGSGGSGVVETAIDLSGNQINSNGFFVVAEDFTGFVQASADLILASNAVNFENNQNTTHFLVRDFTGGTNDDLDADEDGVIDSPLPWSEVVDSVATVDSFTSGNLVYSDTQVANNAESDRPGHAYRCSPGGTWVAGLYDEEDGTDTPGATNLPCPELQCGGDAPRNCFEARAEPGCSDASCCELVAAADAACAEIEWDANCVALAQSLCWGSGDAPTLVLSEVRVEEPGADDNEFFEVIGDPGQSLDGVSLLVIGGTETDINGTIELAVNLSGYSIPSSGYFVAAKSSFTLGSADAVVDMNFDTTSNKTHMLVYNFAGTVKGDIDADNDCTLDTTPWDATIDGLNLLGTGSNCTYASASIGPDGPFMPAHSYLCDTNTWAIGAFDPADELAVDTPGTANASDCDITDCPGYVTGGVDGNFPCTYILETLRPSCCQTWDSACQSIKNSYCNFGASAPDALSLREVRTNQPGSDVDEYVEIQGEAGVDLAGYAVLAIGESNPGENNGVIEMYAPLLEASTDANGLAVLANGETFTLGTADASFDFSFENNDNLTILLVYGYTGETGEQDIDTDDDGVFDITPWVEIVDCVAIINAEANGVDGNLVYCGSQVGPDKVTGFAPQHVYFDCDLGSWQIGAEDPAEGVDSPNVVNNGCDVVVVCPGDLNGDGTVDGADLTVLLGDWGGSTADLNGDSTVDGADLTVLLGAWGPC